MTEQNPAPTPAPPAQPPAPSTPPAAPTPTPPGPAPTEPPPAQKQPPWGKPENFDADKAWELIQNLRTEKGGDPALRGELEQLRNNLASALGVKPEETSDADKLAQQIESLRGQILASEKRALAIEFKVPEAMLTAADAEALRAQATSLAEFAQAAHYAAITAAPPIPPPAFQQNPGQGQGNTPPSPDALADAEYEKYYPPKQSQ